MRYITVGLFSIAILIYCCSSSPEKVVVNSPSIEEVPVSIDIEIPDSLSIPSYFEWMCRSLMKDSTTRITEEFKSWAEENSVEPGDSANFYHYASIHLLHSIFTSTSASNGSRGYVISAPYMWHWISPNPRHEIISLKENKLLKDKKPPKEYSKYTTYADMDRTPWLFISEMLSKEPLYSHPSCDTFNTFGWCSEREMAYTCLLEMLGMKSKVIASGNHSWSEAMVSFKTKEGSKKILLHVDNTFDILSYQEDPANINRWNSYTGDGKTATWYNSQAHSESEMKKLRNQKVDPRAGKMIYTSLHNYFGK